MAVVGWRERNRWLDAPALVFCAGSGHESSENRALGATSLCSADVRRTIQSGICSTHRDEGWIIAANAISSSTSEASDQVIVLSNIVLGAAKGGFDIFGKVRLVLMRKKLENDARNGDRCSEDDDIRSEGRDGYWRRHHDGLQCGFNVARSSGSMIKKMWNLVQSMYTLFFFNFELRCLKILKFG